ncbi:MAG: squalene/phytoene synthase family protein, partial [Pseudomonadota bacterium]
LGEIRLQWWRETIEGLYAGAPRRHDVALALAEAIDQAGLDREPLDRLIDAHSFDLYETPMPDLASLEDYCDAVFGGAIRLACRLLSPSAPQPDLAKSAGIAYGLGRTLADLTRQLDQRQMFLPVDMLAARGVDPEALFARGTPDGLIDVLDELRGRLRERHAAARGLIRSAPSELMPALLPAALAPVYGDGVKRMGADLLSERFEPAPLQIRWRYFRAVVTGGI